MLGMPRNRSNNLPFHHNDKYLKRFLVLKIFSDGRVCNVEEGSKRL